MNPNRVVDTSGVIVYSGTYLQCWQYVLDADLPEGLRVEEVSCDDGEDEEPPFDLGYIDLSYTEDYVRLLFAENSALRAGPRIHPCPTCKAANRLTVADVNLGYQCDDCADAEERGYP